MDVSGSKEFSRYGSFAVRRFIINSMGHVRVSQIQPRIVDAAIRACASPPVVACTELDQIVDIAISGENECFKI